MAKDYKYEDSTPVDEPVRKGSKVQEPGSGIRVDGKPVKAAPKDTENVLAEAADNTVKMIARKRTAAEEAGKSKMNAMGDTYAKGGSASSRADGCCVKGKTKGKYL
jgi:hypothetical protein